MKFGVIIKGLGHSVVAYESLETIKRYIENYGIKQKYKYESRTLEIGLSI